MGLRDETIKELAAQGKTGSCINYPRLRWLDLLCETTCMCIQGDVAEFGVYKGGSARVLAAARPPKRKLHLFDTFTGIPKDTIGIHDMTRLGGMFADAKEADVRAYFKDDPDVLFHVGPFAEVLKKGVLNETYHFAFVHLDCDTYEGYRDGLNYFWPRMDEGGCIVFDDYPHPYCVGTQRAVAEFCSLYRVTPYQPSKPLQWMIRKVIP